MDKPTSASALPEYYRCTELADLFRCSIWTIRANASKHPERLPPFVRVCGRLLFRRNVVEAWIASRAAPASSGTAMQPIPKRGRGRPRKAEAYARARFGGAP